MEEKVVVKLVDFSKTPGGRYRSDGKFSGQEFRDDILSKSLEEAIRDDKMLQVDLDGTYGTPYSWLEEVFGGLGRKYGKEVVQKHLELISEEEPDLIDRIIKDISVCYWTGN